MNYGKDRTDSLCRAAFYAGRHFCGFLLSALLLKKYDALNVLAFVSLALVCLGIYIVNHVKNVPDKNATTK